MNFQNALSFTKLLILKLNFDICMRTIKDKGKNARDFGQTMDPEDDQVRSYVIQ